MTGIQGWSTIAASNATSQGPTGGANIAELCQPSGLNDAIRDVMSQLRATAIPLQVVTTQTGALATGTTTIPQDDTIPQITEGTEFITRAITPTSTTNVLIIDIVANLGHNSASAYTMAGALFQDSTANALTVGWSSAPIGGVTQIRIRHRMLAGTTSSTTFRFRAGSSAAGTTTFNGVSGGRIFGGVMNSVMTVTEYLA